MYICVRGIFFTSVSSIFKIYFEIVADSVVFFGGSFFILLLHTFPFLWVFQLKLAYFVFCILCSDWYRLLALCKYVNQAAV